MNTEQGNLAFPGKIKISRRGQYIRLNFVFLQLKMFETPPPTPHPPPGESFKLDLDFIRTID